MSRIDAAPPDATARAALRLRGPGPLLLVLALALAGGLLADAAGPGQRIDLLSPPWLALLGWNLGVYLLLAVAALRRRPVDPAREARTVDLGRLLHAGAAALALGLCIGLYARGLVFDYRAGWQSTFLEAPQVHVLLATLLAPASALTGIGVPDVQGIAALRIAAGESARGPAAGWIHLFATTLLLAVVVPRTLLALRAGARARRLAALPSPRTEPVPVPPSSNALRVLPHALPAVDAGALARTLDARITLAPAVAFGAEAEAAAPPGDGTLWVLVALAATPEAEHHGALLERLRDATPSLLVDESGFAARFAHDPARIDERRAAWRRFGDARGVALRFVDLGTPPA